MKNDNKNKDTIIGVFVAILFSAMFATAFINDIDYTYERSLEIAEQAKEEQQRLAEQAHEQYIAPVDEFLIELMEKNHESR